MRSLGTPVSIQNSSASSSRGTPSCAFEDGDVEAVFGDAEPLGAGDQFPGEGDGVALEVVAEAEVAQHLEEGVVAAGEADVFKVVVLAAGADALLRSGGAGVVALLGAEEEVLELVHAGVGEQQRGIVGRHQRRRVHAAVALGLKKAQKQLANFVSRAELHDSFSVTGNTAVRPMHPAYALDRFDLRRLLQRVRILLL